ncbi:MAG TPA: AmmeMemoRadiSam system protein B [Sedimenticola sp.]|nr:AmmeMemoRadiSam system protein B [Sedimenticola sp.]
MKRALSWLLVFFLLSLASAAMATGDRVRPSALAGRGWYPGDPAQLRQTVDRLLDGAGTVRLESRLPLRALILPHAGYSYSGATAAKGLALVRGHSYRRVLLLAPAHRVWFEGLSILDVDAYQTPLGKVPLDRAAIRELRRSPLVGDHPRAHAREHSIEIELPLLQEALAPGWKLVPVLVGELNGEQYRQAAELLRPLADEQTLVLVSSDFTHYGKRFDYTPFPADARVAERIRDLDQGALKRILAGDLDGFLGYRRKTGITICGYRPIALLLAMLPPDARLEQVAYATSGELTGDYHNSVSYAVVAVTSKQPLAGSDPPAAGATALTRGDMELLHRLAVMGIEQAVLGADADRERRLKRLEERLPAALKRPAGAFVTLKEEGQLRGCIGYIAPVKPLYRAVLENGYNAARRDYRFQPVNADELPALEVEVSVLTPPRPIPSWRDFRVGEQGIILEKGGRRAVFLPEVAREQGWDREQTLSHLARKAGLPADAWREGARFQVFESRTFQAPYRAAGPVPAADGSRDQEP